MPKIYRVMSESNGDPEVGSERNMLGVRPSLDIIADAEGKIRPEGKGMSVNICPCQVPGAIMLARLNDINIKRGAIGDNTRKVWRMGNGDFVAAPVAVKLDLFPDAKGNFAKHGVVQPDAIMSLDDYQSALADTKMEWNVDEQRSPNCPVCHGA